MLEVVASAARRAATDWPAIAAVALAVVLGHSAVVHLAGDDALARHYQEAVGMAPFALVVGVLQLVAAAALVVPRTRSDAGAAVAGFVLASVAHQVATGRTGSDTLAALAIAATAAAIRIGAARPRR